MNTNTDGNTQESPVCTSVAGAEVTSHSNGTILKDYNGDLDMENFDLIAKVIELLGEHNLWGPDGTYTFKDGERWARVDVEDDEDG